MPIKTMAISLARLPAHDRGFGGLRDAEAPPLALGPIDLQLPAFGGTSRVTPVGPLADHLARKILEELVELPTEDRSLSVQNPLDESAHMIEASLEAQAHLLHHVLAVRCAARTYGLARRPWHYILAPRRDVAAHAFAPLTVGGAAMPIALKTFEATPANSVLSR